MLKILEPFWKGASLGPHAAPLKKGSRISQIPANGIALSVIGCIDYLAYGGIFTRAVFPFVAKEAKK